MAWSHSHTPEAYENARRNLESWSAQRLIEAICDDHYEYLERMSEYSPAMIANACTDLKNDLTSEWERLDNHDTLVDQCMKMVIATNTCDNGGGNFWIDREGYHKVSTSIYKED